MVGFYDDMADMARDLLAPTSKGGLGQGVIAIVRQTEVPAPNEWEAPTYVESTEVLNGAVKGVSADLVSSAGFGGGGPVILATDLQAVCTPPKSAFSAGDIMTIDGKPLTVIRYDNIPPAGVTVVTRFILRG